MAALRVLVNRALVGRPLAAASVAVAELPETAPAALRGVITTVASVLIETLVEHPEERLLLGGTANLTRNAADFPGSLRQILEALEEQVVVLKLLASAQDPSTVTVRIGGENEAEEMRDTSVRLDRLRNEHRARRNGRGRAHPDGLSGLDRGGACRRPVRR